MIFDFLDSQDNEWFFFAPNMLSIRTVGAKREYWNVRVIQLFRQLRYPIPPLQVETRIYIYLTTVSGSGLSRKSDTGYAHLVEPVSPIPLSQVIDEVEFGVKSSERSKCDVLAAAVLTLCILRHDKVVDINHIHLSLAHSQADFLKQITNQHGIRLTGELVSCSACSRMTKDIYTATYDWVCDETNEPSLHRHRWALLCVICRVAIRHHVRGSASRLQWPYGPREKTASAILAVVKLFVADMVVPHIFRTNNGTECSNSIFVDYCITVGIWREFTTPHTPQQNGL